MVRGFHISACASARFLASAFVCRSARTVASTLALAGAATSLLTPVAGADSPFAVTVVSYSPGTGVPPSYQNAASALGSPSRYTGAGIDPGVVTPFYPAFMPADVVSVGPGGSLVLSFDHDVTHDPGHPFGIDILVFGNSFFADLDPENGVCGALFAEGGIIDVSADGIAWSTVPGVVADGLFPTLGYQDTGPYDIDAGSVPTDFTKPVDPSVSAISLMGMSWEDLKMVYAGSGGGAGVSLAAAGVSSARFVRIRVPVGAGYSAEIDGVSAVSAPAAPLVGDLNGDGAVNGADLGILLAAWGPCPGCVADLTGDGVVDGADLAILLGHWG